MASDNDFNVQIGKTLNFEGGYVNDPDDPGGETNFGITRRSYPDVDIANLTIDDAINIYKRDFWSNTGIHSLPSAVAQKTFDLAVNMGVRAAIVLLQRAINHAQSERQIAVDGMIGSETRGAAERCAQAVLVMRLRIEASNHYQQIATDHPGMVKYLRGWLRRAAA